MAPRPSRVRVGRAALLQRLDSAVERRLTIVSAPAGFGKTTLLAEWHETLRERGHLTAWLSLDDDDDDPQLFGAYLLAALNREEQGVGRRAAELLSQDPLTPMKTVQAVLINDIADCNRQVFLFLDDFERVTSRPSVALLSRMLRYAPTNFHVLMGTRRDPCLPVGTLLRDEQALTLGADDLRFTGDEAQNFFSQIDGVLLDRPSIELLNESTEGWVTGLQLTSLALRDSGDAARLAREIAGNRFGIDAYLDETVFAQLPPAVLQFVMRVSILDRLCAGVCDAVMGNGARSWDKLAWLEHHNVFIRAIDRDHRWYRFHALLIEASRRRAEQQMGAELPALHRRASHWFAAESMWPEAVRHALAGGEIHQAAAWAERCASALIDRSDVHTLMGWFAKLPTDLVDRRPRLRLARAWGLTLSFRIDEATHFAQVLADDLAAGRFDADAATSGAEVDASLMTEVAAVTALIAGFADDTPRSLLLGLEVEKSTAPAPPWAKRFAQAAQVFGLAYDGRFDEVRRLRAGLPEHEVGAEPLYATVYRASMMGLAEVVEGRLDAALITFQTALSRAEDAVGRNSAAAVLPAGYLVALHYERNDLVQAQQVMSGRTAIAMQACPLGSLLRFCRGSARIYARQGDVDSALVVLEEAREIASERHWLRLRAGCDAEAGRLYLQSGRIERAEQIADALRDMMPTELPSPMGSFLETWASFCVLRARIAIARGSPEVAVELLHDVRLRLAHAGMRYLEACASAVLSIALEQRGDSPEALDALEHALRFARSQPMVSSFTDEGDAMLTLLRRRQQDSVNRGDAPDELLTRLIATFERDQAAPADRARVHAASAVLSAREVDILDHVSRGLSNKEIARAMRVAPETIKWHLKNIFEKLDVSSRIEAVQSGLGLIRSAGGVAPVVECAQQSPPMAKNAPPRAATLPPRRRS
jgi:LuxR family maltose regulon positive regulatory protein